MTRSRLTRVATLASQFVNVLLCNGWPDETVSGRAWRQGVLGGHAGWSRAAWIIDTLCVCEEGHCRRSHNLDVEFARMILAEA